MRIRRRERERVGPREDLVALSHEVFRRELVGRHDHRAEVEGEVAVLRRLEAARAQLSEHREAAHRLAYAHHRGRSHERLHRLGAAGPLRLRTGRQNCRRVCERERARALEDAHRRWVVDRREQGHLSARVDGVLARSTAAEEERLERLRRKVDHALAVHATDPAALHRLAGGMEHAEPHGVFVTRGEPPRASRSSGGSSRERCGRCRGATAERTRRGRRENAAG